MHAPFLPNLLTANVRPKSADSKAVFGGFPPGTLTIHRADVMTLRQEFDKIVGEMTVQGDLLSFNTMLIEICSDF